MNAPYVDLSYKWAGGGFISSTKDLIRFGNIMLYSYQSGDHGNASNKHKKDLEAKKGVNKQLNIKDTVPLKIEPKKHECLTGYLKPETVKTLWSVADKTMNEIKTEGYGMGWSVIPESYHHGYCRHSDLYTYHTGGAVGGSSVLVISPRSKVNSSPGHDLTVTSGDAPRGVVVAILTNMTGVGLTKTAQNIIQEFNKVQ